MKVMAHRGYSGVYPENTMLSFREAVKVGCDAIEMDVHETRDGRLVVIHDERLDRTTDGPGRVCDHSFAELQQVNAACYMTRVRPRAHPVVRRVLRVGLRRVRRPQHRDQDRQDLLP